MISENPITFDAALVPGLAIEAHWTNAGRHYVVPATVTKLNARSLLVQLAMTVYDHDVGATVATRIVYPSGHVITLPRLGARNYSANNGAYPAKDIATDTVADEKPPDRADDTLTLDLDPEVLDETAVPTCLQDDLAMPPDITAILYTTAPADLDLAHTQEVQDLGTLLSRDGLRADTYRKVIVPSFVLQVLQDQQAAYGSGGWNTHTPAEFADLLDQPWFQQRFVPVGIPATVANEAQEPGASARTSEVHVDLCRPIRDYRTVPVLDTAPAPAFDRDDGVWLASLDARLTREPALGEDTLEHEACEKVLRCEAEEIETELARYQDSLDDRSPDALDDWAAANHTRANDGRSLEASATTLTAPCAACGHAIEEHFERSGCTKCGCREYVWDVLSVAPGSHACANCGQGRLTGAQRLCGDCVAALEAGTADTPLRFLALAARGREAVAAALGRGEWRAGKAQNTDTTHKRTSLDIKFRPDGRMHNPFHRTLMQKYEQDSFPPILYSVRKMLCAAGYLHRKTGPSSDTLTIKGREYCAQFWPVSV